MSSANQSTPHFHHGYRRFDFTVQTSSNNLIFERNDPPLQPGTNVWQAQPFEIRRLRDPAHQRRWWVQHADSGRGYTIHIVGPRPRAARRVERLLAAMIRWVCLGRLVWPDCFPAMWLAVGLSACRQRPPGTTGRASD